MPPDPFSVDLEEWLSCLDRSGCRLTEPLKVVTEVMSGNRRALSPVEVYDLGRAIYPKLGLVTVYRSLEKLESAGLVQRVHQVGGCNGYIAAPQGHQHLLICQICGRAEYFTGDDISDLVSRVEAQSHYTVQGHWLQLFGVCESCK
ncbi:MAG: transcriptional repressor [Anaerolineae bacterium]|nr:transcriptional repressor [Anaerolineae bacterium]